MVPRMKEASTGAKHLFLLGRAPLHHHHCPIRHGGFRVLPEVLHCPFRFFGVAGLHTHPVVTAAALGRVEPEIGDVYDLLPAERPGRLVEKG